MVVVVKFGGATLETADGITESARGVFALSQSQPVVVVVSARGQTTNRLYDDITAIHPHPPPEFLEPFLLTGETQSVFLFASALSALGGRPFPVTPFDASFPLRVALKVDQAPEREKVNELRPFKVLWKLSREAASHLVTALQDRHIPVVAGFAAQTRSGKVVTLGRGGSDITAFVLARLLKAREVILVKDMEGLLTADPRFSPGGRKVRTLSQDALANLVSAGSQVLHPGTLRFLSDKIRVRFSDRSLTSITGTEVLADPFFAFKNAPEIVSAITIIGHGFSFSPSVVGRLLKPLEDEKIRVIGSALFEDDLTVYVPDSAGESAYILLSREATRLSQVTTTHLRRNLARLIVEHRHLLDQAQELIRALRALRSQRIPIHGILVLRSEVHIFISSEDLIQAQECLVRAKPHSSHAVSSARH